MTTRRTATANRRAKLHAEIVQQIAWIRDHGGNEAGYVARYGSRHDAECYGDGGELIYAADLGALTRLQDQYRAAVRRYDAARS